MFRAPAAILTGEDTSTPDERVNFGGLTVRLNFLVRLEGLEVLSTYQSQINFQVHERRHVATFTRKFLWAGVESWRTPRDMSSAPRNLGTFTGPSVVLTIVISWRNEQIRQDVCPTKGGVWHSHAGPIFQNPAKS
jgi:hypothetical protein